MKKSRYRSTNFGMRCASHDPRHAAGTQTRCATKPTRQPPKLSVESRGPRLFPWSARLLSIRPRIRLPVTCREDTPAKEMRPSKGAIFKRMRRVTCDCKRKRSRITNDGKKFGHYERPTPNQTDRQCHAKTSSHVLLAKSNKNYKIEARMKQL